mgnify:CR=1 FL=1
MGADELFDAIVIGAGPAGLTAALYLARYRRRTLVLHDGTSRALRIPRSHNVAGFPDGVTGPELIARMTEHAARYGASFETVHIDSVRREAGAFELSGDGRAWRSRALILATGVALNEVALDPDAHQLAIEAGVLRYCPICDGFEASDKTIGVLGCGANGAAEALFLRQYSPQITLMPLVASELTSAQIQELTEAGVTVERGALQGLAWDLSRIAVALEGRAAELSFGVLYPALGCAPRTELAAQLGVQMTPEGFPPPDAPRETNVPGLFFAGDVVEGLDQVNVATGQGSVAATCVHNWLRAQDHETLEARAD